MTKKQDIMEVNMGLDIGTSNTKVVICEDYNAGPDDRKSYVVDFKEYGHEDFTDGFSNNSEFKDMHLQDTGGHIYMPFIKTCIDYDTKKGYLLHETSNKTDAKYKDLKYQFMKYLTKNGTPTTEEDVETIYNRLKPNLIKSDEYKNLKAFISCVIVYSAQWFVENIKKQKTDFNVNWNTYMGIPDSMTFSGDIVARKLEYKAYELLFKEACEEAFKILGTNHKIQKIMVLPELTAVAFTTATTQNMNDELFCGVDIGDGTMDVLVSKVTKTTDEFGTPKTEFKCFAGRVYQGLGGRGFIEADDKVVFQKKIINEISSVLKKAYEVPEYNMSWDIGMKIFLVGGGSMYPQYKYALYQVDHDVLYPELRTGVLKPTSYNGISFMGLNIQDENWFPINSLNDKDLKESSFKEYLVKRFAVAKGLACVSSVEYDYGSRYMTSNL